MCENKTQTTFEWIIQLPPFAPRLLLFSAPPTASIMSHFFRQLRNSDVGTVLQKPSKYKLSYPAPQGAVIIFPLPSPAFACCTYLRPHTRLVPPTDFRNFSYFYVPCVISLPLFLSFVTRVFHLFSFTGRMYTHLLMCLLMFVLCLTRRYSSRQQSRKEGIFSVWRSVDCFQKGHIK